jgi:hypothetical protein
MGVGGQHASCSLLVRPLMQLAVAPLMFQALASGFATASHFPHQSCICEPASVIARECSAEGLQEAKSF